MSTDCECVLARKRGLLLAALLFALPALDLPRNDSVLLRAMEVEGPECCCRCSPLLSSFPICSILSNSLILRSEKISLSEDCISVSLFSQDALFGSATSPFSGLFGSGKGALAKRGGSSSGGRGGGHAGGALHFLQVCLLCGGGGGAGRSCARCSSTDAYRKTVVFCQVAALLLISCARHRSGDGHRLLARLLCLLQQVGTAQNVLVRLGGGTVAGVVRCSVVLQTRVEDLASLHLSPAVEARAKVLQTFIVGRTTALLAVAATLQQFAVRRRALQVVDLIQVFYCVCG